MTAKKHHLLTRVIYWGGGIAKLAATPVRLADPTIRAGSRVTHLRYRVLR